MRKLATIQQIEKLTPIEGADKIVKADVKGWSIVVGKDLYQVGDYVIFHEIDSAFRVGQEPYHTDLQARGTKQCELEDGSVVPVYRISTIKLKGTLSQGYCVPISSYSPELQKKLNKKLIPDYDVTELLGVIKFERPENSNGKQNTALVFPKGRINIIKWKIRKWLEYKFPKYFKRKKIKSSFPTFLHKSECIRIQNYKEQMYEHYLNDTLFSVTYKLDGSSISVARKGKEEFTCSRNLRKNPNSVNDNFIINGNKIHQAMKSSKYASDYCFQGELISPKIQGNFEGVKEEQVYIYSMWDIATQQYVNPLNVLETCKELGLPHVPVLHQSITLKELFPVVEDSNDLLQQLLTYADGPSGINGKYREGLVYKECKDGYQSIKTISNRYLLKVKD